MIISQNKRKARKRYYCGNCERVISIGDQYTDMYGAPERGDKPYHLKICQQCKPIEGTAEK